MFNYFDGSLSKLCTDLYISVKITHWKEFNLFLMTNNTWKDHYTWESQVLIRLHLLQRNDTNEFIYKTETDSQT